MHPFSRNGLAASAFLLTTTAAFANDNVMVVFDGSNSMWGQIDGTAKIEIARDVMDNLLGDWADDRTVGLMAYGHRTRGDCSDIEVLVQPGAAQRSDILSRIQSITPTGKTPLTDAVEQAAKQLSYTDQPATVVLISDGLESCERDPCELARALEKGGVGFTAHVVGFGLGNEEDTASLSCIAEETGGQYIQASNADELGAALSAVATAVAEPEPEPEPEPAAPQVVVDGPDTAVGGASIRVTWSPTIASGDYLTVVPVGSEPGTLTHYQIAGDRTEVFVKVPGDEGFYEVRYVSAKTKETLGFEALDVAKPEVTISAPDQAVAGALVKIQWAPTINSADYLTIVPAGSAEGTLATYRIASDDSEMELPIGGLPGLYEVRYILNVDKRTVASHTIEATEPNVTIAAPDTVLIGEKFDVTWTDTVNPGDYITFVPAGAEEGTLAEYGVPGDRSQRTFTAPGTPGIYEARYVLREGRRTLATAMVEVTEASVTLSGPATALTGAPFKVSWSDAINPNDFITIVPVGADAKASGNYVRVYDKSENNLTAPADPGMYELRYVLREGGKIMATAMIEITEPEVTLSAPQIAATGSRVGVSWTGAVNPQDYVTIVPVGADAKTSGDYVRVYDKTEGAVTAPADPGMYELRYVLREGGKVMATAMIEITDPEVTLSGPETAITGSKVTISWAGAVNAQDFITVVPVGADAKESGAYFRVYDKSENALTMPPDPGMYELRYILREGGKVMATAMIEITDPEVTLAAPDAVATGSKFKVSWTGGVNPQDYITIVPVGAEPATSGSYIRVYDKSEGALTAPADPGLYEVRYMLNAGKKMLANTMVEVAVPSVTLDVASEIRAGDTLTFSWGSSVNPQDYVTLVPMGTPDGESADYIRVYDKTSGKFTAPDTTGMYELRYVLREGNRVMARAPVEVLAQDAALNTGATLSAPEVAAPGSTIEVTWAVDSTSADQRITLARGNQAIFTWLQAVKIDGASSVQINLPDETGVYELRFLDVSGQAVLARKVIKVE